MSGSFKDSIHSAGAGPRSPVAIDGVISPSLRGALRSKNTLRKVWENQRRVGKSPALAEEPGWPQPADFSA